MLELNHGLKIVSYGRIIMESFLVRLCSAIHWIAFLITCWLIYVVFSNSNNLEELSLINLTALVLNIIGWLIKFIFTGNGRFFPF